MVENIKNVASPRLPYIWLILAVAALAAISNVAGGQIVHRLAGLEDAPSAPVLAAFVLFALCSFASFHTTRGTPLPSFVVAIALGIAGHTLFAPIVNNPTALASIVTGSAAIILFSGGLEMPLRDFIRLLLKIALLAFPGVLIAGFALSLVIGGVSQALGVALAVPVVILLGAILASTDPAAIIPVLQDMRFRRRATKDIVVAESALNDVVGALLTTVFLKLPLAAITVFFSVLAGSSFCGFCRDSRTVIWCAMAPIRSTSWRRRCSPLSARRPLAAAAFWRRSLPACCSTPKST
jgi:Kef-type K+ transport system membrane component KefB